MQGMFRVAQKQSVRQCVQVVVQWLTSGDHGEFSPFFVGLIRLLNQFINGSTRVVRLWPGVFGVAPGATHPATSQSDEKGAATGVEPLTLQ